MKKRILSLLLALVMIIGMIPTNSFTVYATEWTETEQAATTESEETTPPTTEAPEEETTPVKVETAVVQDTAALAETTYDVYVGGVGMANGTYLANNATTTRPDKPSVGYAYYQDGVLTLHNYSLSSSGGYMYDSAGYYALIYADKDLKIVLEGENTLNQTMRDNEGIYFRLNGEVSGDGTLAVSGYTYYGIAAEAGNLTVNAATVTVSGGKIALYSDQGNVIINGGYTDVSADQDAIYAKEGSVYITDGELTAKSATDLDGYLGSARQYCAIKGAGGVSYANHLIVKAALKDDGQLGAYGEDLQNSYDLIVVKNYPILLGVKTTGGMVGESEEGGIVFFDSCESVFSRECNEETTWTVSELRTESGELNTQPVAGETYYFDITVNGENINFSGVSAMNCDVKLDFYDVAFVKATNGAVHATITFSATRRLTHHVLFYFRGDEYPISGRSIEDGQLLTKPEDPGKEGMHFLGWYTEDGELYDFDVPVTENINLYATFGHYVNFWFEGDEYPIFGQEIEDGQTATKPADPGKEGKVFKGWYTEDGQPYDFSTPVKADLNLYAKFAKIHTVTFYLGESPTATQDIEDGKTVSEPEDPYQQGKKFLGWYTEDNQLYDFSTPVTGDLNLHAKFVKSHTVTLMFGDSAVGWLTAEDGKPVEKPEDPGQEGKTFLGWYTDDDELYDFSAPVTEDIKLYAKFETVADDITVTPVGDMDYTVEGNKVTVEHDETCKVGYLKDGKYVAVEGTKNEDGSYSFEVPEGVTEVTVVVAGDATTGDGKVDSADATLLARSVLPSKHPAYLELTPEQFFALDINGDGKIDSADTTLLSRSILPDTHRAYKPLDW